MSHRHEKQTYVLFWNSIAKIYVEKSDLSISTRKAESLRSRWNVLQRQVQKYLEEERIYRPNPVSGESEGDIIANVTPLYRSRTNNTGQPRNDAQFRSIRAVQILRECSKFYGGGEKLLMYFLSTSLII